MSRRMMKGKHPTKGDHIQKVGASDDFLTFSFRLFDSYDVEMCPARFPDGYCQILMQRMRDLSSWKVSEFTGRKDRSVRNHTHDWEKTARPDGFPHLNEQYKALAGWQFCLTANEHGRVHGIIIENTFYVIWLDCDHKLYPTA